MPSFRQTKEKLFYILSENNWQSEFKKMLNSNNNPSEMVSPLLSFILRQEIRWQSIACFGLLMTVIAEKDKEKSRVIMRRLMWSMNEESGNIGWGIPECMGSTFANCKPLADEYAKILFSYAIDTGDDDNFIDHEPLRLGVYWGVAACAWNIPELLAKSLAIFAYAMKEDSETAKALGCFGLLRLMESPDMLVNAQKMKEFATVFGLVETLHQEEDSQIDIFANEQMQSFSIHNLTGKILDLERKTI